MPQYVTAIRTSEGDKKIDYTALANKEHAKQHSASGTDPILLTDIGAAKATHASQHSSSGSDPITPSDIGAAKKDHASQHATGGADPIAPASIGAASLTHASQHAAGGADAITPEMIGTYTKEQILSADTATAFGLGEGAEPKDFFKKIYDDGGTYRVGDVLSTVRTDLGDKWILCDGNSVYSNDYPDFKKLFTAPGIKSISDVTTYYINDVAYYNGRWVAVGYNYASKRYPIIITTTKLNGKWTLKQMSTKEGTLNKIACYNGTWVAVGEDSSEEACVYSTTNPTGEWVESKSEAVIDPTYLVCYNGVWVMGDEYIYVSTVPYGTWTQNRSFGTYFYDVCYYNGTWIFLDYEYVKSDEKDSDGDPIYHYYPKLVMTTDPFGSTFTEKTLEYVGKNCYPKKIFYDGNKFFVFCTNSSSNASDIGYVYTATDPTGDWTAKDISIEIDNINAAGFGYCNGQFILFDSNDSMSGMSHPYVYTTTNPLGTWKKENVADIDFRATTSIGCSDDTWVTFGIGAQDDITRIMSSALIQLPNISLDRVNTYIKAKQ